MNEQQKQLDDLLLDEIVETFEMKVDTKFYSYKEDRDQYLINF